MTTLSDRHTQHIRDRGFRHFEHISLSFLQQGLISRLIVFRMSDYNIGSGNSHSDRHIAVF
jgi:hypothetical protein